MLSLPLEYPPTLEFAIDSIAINFSSEKVIQPMVGKAPKLALKGKTFAKVIVLKISEQYDTIESKSKSPKEVLL